MTQSRTNAEVWDSITLDLISIQVEGEIVFINIAGAQMLGASTPGQLVGKPILDFVHPDYREIAAERVRQMTTEGIVVCPSEEKWLRLDGTAIDVEVAAMPVFYRGKLAVQLIVREDDGCKSYRPARKWHSAFRSRRKRQP
jgi:PAS domain S-box-containing protein